MKLGLFGGSFDPIHNAHLFIAEAARISLGLDRILFLPTRNAHHREPSATPIEDRLAMLRAAIVANPHFALDLTDCDGAASGYTADLIPLLRDRYPGDEFTFVIGEDNLIRSTWQRLDEVFSGIDALAIAPRIESRPQGDLHAAFNAFLASLAPAQREKIRVLDLPPLAESATTIRSQIARGGSIRYLIPEPVYRLIEERRLYRQTPMLP
ncbi:MAG TPA: nicotinate (nicotinamide) nucleotide adenylyltransferase [Candidatus Baltobacteraceae bacterium]|nr:nicotinate (nicotinamide) nucleotide adenylyltransferase [Candidatus Baltobacteraceae bacterium]